MSFPRSIYTAAQVRELDRYAIETLGLPGYELMTRAGKAALLALKNEWPHARSLVVICGPGNNAGDGYVLARLAKVEGIGVTTIAITDPAKLRGDARRAYEDFSNDDGAISSWSASALDSADVIVDAMFGTGLSRPLDANVVAVIEALNTSGRPVLALDVPSGLQSDTGEVMGASVRAHLTITFIGLKLGFYLGRGPDFVGNLAFDDLGVSHQSIAHLPSSANRITEDEIPRVLPPRPRTAHKGQNGDVLIVGGGAGMAGAARLAGEAALRSGAGRVTVATRPENVSAIVSARPELMCRGIQDASELESLIERMDIVAIGPGLGQNDWSRTMFDTALHCQRTTIMDADALNLLAQRGTKDLPSGLRVLTPHPGEAGRLIGMTSAEIQRDRLAAARTLAEQFASIVVLKGAASIVMGSNLAPAICDHGNPGMASPGMGDVLTGVIAAVAGQSKDLYGAVRVAVLAHAMAGDLAARRGQRGMIASDLFEHLPTCLNAIPSK